MNDRIFSTAVSVGLLAATPVMGTSFEGLGDLPGGKFESSAQRVSDNGLVVVGYGTTASGQQAFRWTRSEGIVSLGNLSDGSFVQSCANDVSADGAVVVGTGDPSTNSDWNSGWSNFKGFRWTQSGGMTNIGSLNGSTRYEAWGVSADGSVVVGDGGSQAFRWTQSGGITGLGVLPGRANSRACSVSADGSVAVGSSYNLPNWDNEQAFRWTQSGGMVGLGYLPGGNSSFANVVSPDGTVVVGTSSSSAGYPSFRWTQSTGMQSIGDLPGGQFWSHPFGVSTAGSVIVGTGSTASGNFNCAYIWDAAHGMRNLQTVLQTEHGLNLTGWTLTCAFDITPDGQVIVGFGTNPSGQQEAWRAVLSSPRLAMTLNGTNAGVSWNPIHSEYVLESAAQLGGTWTPVPGVTNCAVTVPVNSESQFFRLRK
ncbi:MAG: PEP-CTERM sorting domain-containing protein [Verrucomicrobiota bacterium]|jgi:probable HAF family extracellular repeat protein